jgi:hypothetical protein
MVCLHQSELTVVLGYYEAMELTVVLDYYEAMETYSRIGPLRTIELSQSGMWNWPTDRYWLKYPGKELKTKSENKLETTVMCRTIHRKFSSFAPRLWPV